MNYWFKILYHKFLIFLKKQVIGNILYRDLVIVKTYPKSIESQCLFFGNQLTVSISQPDCINQEFHKEIDEKLGVYSPIRKYCKIFDNCLIIGGNKPIVFDSREKPLWNAIAYQFFKFSKNYYPIIWWILKNKLPLKEHQSYVFLLYTNWCSNYFHWLFDNLARLEFLDYFEDISREIKVYVPNNLLPFQKESLAALGIKNIEPIGEFNIRVKHLVVPNFPLEQQGYDLEQIYWLRDKIYNNIGIANEMSKLPNQNILILRKTESGRSLINQEEVLHALKPLGFQGYYLEKLTFQEQVQLFSNANCVVGVHGAGLANIIFAKQPMTVIEIFANQVFPCYFQLAKTLGFSYNYILNDSEQEYTGKQSDIQVNVNSLVEIIYSLILNH
ncbi:MAG: glycosyltransferase family 61 protein [Moorea sp. SIO3G5]|nr:glycosyltransferase family 61 protein [Moorena sp. SIO3G5]